MNISTNIPSGMTYADYNRLMSNKVQFITVNVLPTENIKEYPYIYVLLPDGKTTGVLSEYKASTRKWIQYGAVDNVIRMTYAEYEALSEEEKNEDVFYLITDRNAYDGEVSVVTRAITLAEYNALSEEDRASDKIIYMITDIDTNAALGIEGWGYQVDTELSTESENPVQNKVVTTAINQVTNSIQDAVAAGSVSITVDGQTVSGLKLKNIEIANAERITDIPYTFTYGSAVVYNNEIHILGGGTSGSTAHYKWDGSSWTSVSTLPYTFYASSAVVYNNDIHILGGGNTYPYTRHYKWDGSSWTSVSTIPYTFQNGAAVVYNNEIHIMGGNGVSPYKQHYKWDGVEWTSASTLPDELTNGSAVVYNNEIHILGDGSNNTNHYRWSGTSWRAGNIYDVTLPYAFSNGYAIVYNNEIHIMGGNSGYYTNHYKWNGTAWITDITLPYGFSSGSAVEYNHNIYLFGSSLKGSTTLCYTLYKNVLTLVPS